MSILARLRRWLREPLGTEALSLRPSVDSRGSVGSVGSVGSDSSASPPTTPPALAVDWREHRLLCANPQGLHQIAYTEWGDAANPEVVVCVHGLTRNARDFDTLARKLAVRYRVVCPDVVGRGASDWLPSKKDYGFPQYCADMLTLLARIGATQVDWVGTSMGGLIGMQIAAQPLSPIRRLVLNDVGARIPAAALRRIGAYVGRAPIFPNLDAADAYIREQNASFGPLTDAQWRHLAQHSVIATEGGWKMRYDPDLGDAFRQMPIFTDLDLWSVYDAIRCPTLVLRGAESDLLEHRTLAEMAQRGPQATVAEICGVGHAPMLMDEAQIALVDDFLRYEPHAEPVAAEEEQQEEAQEKTSIDIAPERSQERP